MLPHERTHRGPKEGRLRLLRRRGAQLEPIFLLYDGAPPVSAARTASRISRSRARGSGGSTRPTRSSRRFADRQLMIADGHHRYETAVALRGGRRLAVADGRARLDRGPGTDDLPDPPRRAACRRRAAVERDATDRARRDDRLGAVVYTARGRTSSLAEAGEARRRSSSTRSATRASAYTPRTRRGGRGRRRGEARGRVPAPADAHRGRVRGRAARRGAPAEDTYFYPEARHRSALPPAVTDWLELCRAASPTCARVLAELPTRVEREPVVGARRGRRRDDRDRRGGRARDRRATRRAARGDFIARLGGDRRARRSATGRDARRPRPDRRLAQRQARRPATSRSRSRSPTGATMDDVEFGYVYDFGSGEEWTARRGEGACLDGERLGAVRPKDDDRDPRLRGDADLVDRRDGAAVVGVAHRLRIMGSLALSLCHLAAGRVDARLLAQAGAARSTSPRRSCSSGRRASRSSSSRIRRSATRRSTSSRARASSRRRTPSSCGRLAAAARVTELRIGCSGWNYKHWRNGVFYPPRLPAAALARVLRALLRHRRGQRDLLPAPAPTAVARLGRADAAGLRVRGQDEPLPHAREAAARPASRASSASTSGSRRSSDTPKLGPVLWQLPADVPPRRRAAARTRSTQLPAGRHAFEFRHPSWFVARGARAPAAARRRARDRRPSRAAVPAPRADRRLDLRALPLRFARTRRQLLRAASSTTGPRGSSAWRAAGDVYAYFNNDWEGYAIRNALGLKGRLGVA